LACAFARRTMNDNRIKPRPHSVRAYVISALLMGLPVLALLAVPLYSRREPTIAGFPMFYWWTYLWIALISAGTWASYRIIGRATARQGK